MSLLTCRTLPYAAAPHPVGSYVVLSRRYDMMKKASEDLAAYRRHFKQCPGVGRCADIGHPGGPKRGRAQAMSLPQRLSRE